MYLARMWIYTYLIFIGIFHDASAMDNEQLAERGQFKYMALVKEVNGRQCSGAIIDRYHILTADTCLENVEPERLFVIVGTVDRNREPGTYYVVRKIHRYQTCGEKIFMVHIAVVTLERPLSFEDNITSLKLPFGLPFPRHRAFDFSGWGVSTHHLDGVRLRYTKMAISSCSNPTLTPNYQNVFYVVDARNERSSISCADIGSPLVIDDVVYGIVYASGYNNQNIIIALKVHYYLHFIDQALEQDSKLFTSKFY